MPPTRILIADDHNLIRSSLRLWLQSMPGVQVVGEASDGREAVAMAVQLQPNVLLMDIGMPELNGLDAAAQVVKHVPHTRVVLLSMHSEPRYVRQALGIGVVGYILKTAPPEELSMAITAVMRGDVWLSPSISRMVVEDFREGQAQPESSASALTPRQREVLQLVAEGRSTKEIAKALAISVKTVETHRAQLMQRLGIYDVPGLVREAVREGLIRIES